MLPYELVNKRVHEIFQPISHAVHGIGKDSYGNYYFAYDAQNYNIVGTEYVTGDVRWAYFKARIYDPLRDSSLTKTVVEVIHNDKKYDILSERVFNLVEMLRMEILSKLKNV